MTTTLDPAARVVAEQARTGREAAGAERRETTPWKDVAGAPLIVVVAWILAFALYEWVRWKLFATGDVALVSNFSRISAFEALQLAMIASLLLAVSPRARVPWWEVVALFTISGAILLVDARPLVSTLALSLLLTMRLVWRSETRALGLAISIFFLQFNPAPDILSIHQPVAALDAAMLHFFLVDNGYDIVRQGSVLIRPSADFGIDVTSGCATSSAVVIVGCGFLITTLCLRGRLVWSDGAWIVGLALLLFVLNQVRLAPMALGREGYDFWHEGFGAEIWSLIFASVALGAGWLAAGAPDLRGRR